MKAEKSKQPFSVGDKVTSNWGASEGWAEPWVVRTVLRVYQDERTSSGWMVEADAGEVICPHCGQTEGKTIPDLDSSWFLKVPTTGPIFSLKKKLMINIKDSNEFKLCYVRFPNAWFTTQELSRQWGERWDHVPYIYHAGYPYEWNEEIDKEKEPWQMCKVAFEFYDYKTPVGPYSVQMINSGVIPWLKNGDESLFIPAGTSLPEFIWLIESVNGNVYLKTSDNDRFENI